MMKEEEEIEVTKMKFHAIEMKLMMMMKMMQDKIEVDDLMREIGKKKNQITGEVGRTLDYIVM